VALPSIFGRFFGSSISTASGVAIGGSVQNTLNPLTQSLANETWALHAVVPPDPYALANGVAQGQVNEASARAWAAESGIGDKQFTALVNIANVGPGVAAAFELWRRHEIDEAGFRRALGRLAIEEEWIDALWKVRESVLDPADLARGIHRGLIPDPGLLQGRLPAREGNVPAYPVYDIDALAEAFAAGYNRDHLGVLVGLQGNPMGAHEAANAVFRGILTEDDYLRAIAEGNTRNEWADAIFEQSRQLPTAREFLENALRGYRTLAEALAGAARHGMSRADALMVYQNQGRPMAVRQITQALARGGVFKPEPGEITDPFDAAIVEGNLKPAYYDLAKSLRYTYPSPFVLRALTQSDAITQREAEDVLLYQGWEPGFAHKVAASWSGGTAAASKELVKSELLDEFEGGFITESELRDHLAALGYQGPELDLEVHLSDARRIKGWRDKAITALNKRYLASTMERSAAQGYLGQIGVHDPDTQTRLLDIWDIERSFK
jgi:hypothetical protein